MSQYSGGASVNFMEHLSLSAVPLAAGRLHISPDWDVDLSLVKLLSGDRAVHTQVFFKGLKNFLCAIRGVCACVRVCVFAQAAVLCSAALKAQGSAKLTPCLSTPELLNTFAEASGNKLKGPISAAICRRAEQGGGSGGVCWYPQPDLQLLLFCYLLLLLQSLILFF